MWQSVKRGKRKGRPEHLWPLWKPQSPPSSTWFLFWTCSICQPQMKTQQQRTQNEGSDELTEELEGFCNKLINSIGLKYLPAPHGQRQPYLSDIYTAFMAAWSRDAGLPRAAKGLRPGAGTLIHHLELKGVLTKPVSPLSLNYLTCKRLSPGLHSIMHFTQSSDCKVACNGSCYHQLGRKGKAKLGGWGKATYFNFLHNMNGEFTDSS